MSKAGVSRSRLGMLAVLVGWVGVVLGWSGGTGWAGQVGGGGAHGTSAQLSFEFVPNTPYTPGTKLTVKLIATQYDTGTYVKAEDQFPSGWAVSNISNSGTVVGGKVTWNITLGGNQTVTLSYDITPPAAAHDKVWFYAVATFSSDQTQQAPINLDRPLLPLGVECTLSCSATAGPDNGTAPLVVQFTGGATPQNCVGTVTYDWNFGDGSAHSTSQSPSHTYTTAGTYQWTLTTKVGSVTCTKTGTITVRICSLSCSASASPSYGALPLSVTFTGQATATNCSGSVTYDWNFGDGSAHATQPSPTHTYTTAGQYTWKMKAMVGGQTCERTGTITVVPCAVTCTAQATPTTGRPPLAVTFSASATPTGCTGTPSYAWKFGDGGTSSAQNPSHTYTAAGSFQWTMTATVSTQSCVENGTITLTESPHVDASWSRAYLVAASAHAAGNAGTSWVSDLVMHNPTPADATVFLYFLAKGGDNSEAVGLPATVPAGQSVKLLDVVKETFDRDATSGAMLIGSDRDLVVTSRTYNNAATGTFGQYIEGYPTQRAIVGVENVRLIQLSQNANYRTNIGFANATGSPLTVTVTLYRSNLQLLGTKTYTLSPFGYFQQDKIITQVTSASVDDAFAVVWASSPSARYFTYASVIDNRTGDPVNVVPVGRTASQSGSAASDRAPLGDSPRLQGTGVERAEDQPEVPALAVDAAVPSGVPWMAGDNTSGQLGYYADGYSRPTPTVMAGVTNAKEVAAGYDHTAVRRDNGSVQVWGLNDNNQLGDQTRTPRSLPGVPFQLPSAIEISALGDHNVAISEATQVWIWGDDEAVPTQVPGLVRADQAEGGYHYLVHTSEHEVWGWGLNSYGEVGDGTCPPTPGQAVYVTAPKKILTRMKSVAVGAYHSLGLTDAGSALAWGRNSEGQLGDGTTERRCSPTVVVGLPLRISQVAAGIYSSAAIAENGDLYTWGYNYNGQLGVGTTRDFRTQPTKVLDQVTGVAIGPYHMLAIRADSSVWSWGYNQWGELGDGTTILRSVPQQVPGVVGAVSVAAGAYHSVVALADGTLRVWGLDESGQLGLGRELFVPTPQDIGGFIDVTSMGLGQTFTVAVRRNGTVSTWGANEDGQLGDGTQSDRPTPMTLPTLSGVSVVSSGVRSTLAVKSDGSVWGWGSNSVGELGLGTAARALVPTQASGVTRAAAVSTAGSHALVLTTTGDVMATGSNQVGQLGDGTTTSRKTFGPVVGLTGVVQIAAGAVHSMGLRSDGTVWVWGGNSAGQLGLSDWEARSTPTQVPGLSGISRIAAGWYHSLAVTSDGRLYAWGRGVYGELGNGTPVYLNKPNQVPLQNVKAIAAAGYQSFAMRTDNSVWAFGANALGNLGTGDTTDRYSPTRIGPFTDIQAVFAGSTAMALLRAAPACTVTCSATAAPTTGRVPLAVSFQGSAETEFCSGQPWLEWDFGDGSTHSTGTAVSHLYQTAGTYTWTMVARADDIPCTKGGSVIVSPGCGAPSAPTLTVPAFATSGAGYKVSWNSTGAGDTYELVEATLPSFAGGKTVYTGTGTSVTLQHSITSPQDYHYRARASRSCGGSTYTSSWSTRGQIGLTPSPAAVPVYVPAGAHVSGVAGTNWRTDLEVHNPGSAEQGFSIALLKRDTANTAPTSSSFSLAPSNSRRFSDILQSVFTFSGAATLRVTPPASEELMVTSRTYNDQPEGTFGQFIPGVPETQAIPFRQDAWLVQLSQSSDGTKGYRTNLGLVNVTGSTINVGIDLFRANGTSLGSVSPLTVLRPYEFKQIDKVFTKVTAGQVDDGYAVLRTEAAGGKFLAYASVIDNRSGDPIYIPAQVPAQGSSGREEITVSLSGGVPLVLARIPAGSFSMGSPVSERGRQTTEGPQHQVTLTRDFYLGKTEVTQAQWRAVMGTLPEQVCGVGDNLPVCMVSWDDIAGSNGFISRLDAYLQSTDQEGVGKFRLPTEAEWEYAARAGTTARFSFGDNLECDVDDACAPCALPNQHIWWCGNSDSSLHPVAQKLPNAFGLYDMSGNIWEWAADWYAPAYPAGAQTDPTGPATPEDPPTRVVRGGRWLSLAANCRSATRFGYPPSMRQDLGGFRLARSL